VRQKAVDSGEVVDWKDRCRKAPRAASGENVEVHVSRSSFPWASDAVAHTVLRMDKGRGEGTGL
jgi:hypothetical protein